ncbi:unnamed protein product [Symbiodinium microadriaticum]|nr:unnamed protein product [Symbiodinium microadriaticum]
MLLRGQGALASQTPVNRAKTVKPKEARSRGGFRLDLAGSSALGSLVVARVAKVATRAAGTAASSSPVPSVLRYFRFHSELPHPVPARRSYVERRQGSGWPEQCPPMQAASAFGWDVINPFDIQFDPGEDGWEIHSSVEVGGGDLEERGDIGAFDQELSAGCKDSGATRSHVAVGRHQNSLSVGSHSLKTEIGKKLTPDSGFVGGSNLANDLNYRAGDRRKEKAGRHTMCPQKEAASEKVRDESKLAEWSGDGSEGFERTGHLKRGGRTLLNVSATFPKPLDKINVCKESRYPGVPGVISDRQLWRHGCPISHKIRRQLSCDSDVTEPEIEQASFGKAKNAQPTKTEQLDDDSESEDEEEEQHRKKPFLLEYRRPPYNPHKPIPFSSFWKEEIEMAGRLSCPVDGLVLEAFRKARREFMAAKTAEETPVNPPIIFQRCGITSAAHRMLIVAQVMMERITYLLVPLYDNFCLLATSTTMHDRRIMTRLFLHLPPSCEMMEKQKQLEKSQPADARLTQAVLIAVSVLCFVSIRAVRQHRATRAVDIKKHIRAAPLAGCVMIVCGLGVKSYLQVLVAYDAVDTRLTVTQAEDDNDGQQLADKDKTNPSSSSGEPEPEMESRAPPELVEEADVTAKDDKDGQQLADKDVAKLLREGLSGYSSSERLESLTQQFEVAKTTVQDLGRRKMQPKFLMQQFGLALGEALAVLDLADPRTTSEQTERIVACGAVKRKIAVLDLTQHRRGCAVKRKTRKIAVLDLTQPLPPPPDPTTSEQTEGIVAGCAVKRKTRKIAVLDLTQPLPPPKRAKRVQTDDAARKPIESTALAEEPDHPTSTTTSNGREPSLKRNQAKVSTYLYLQTPPGWAVLMLQPRSDIPNVKRRPCYGLAAVGILNFPAREMKPEEARIFVLLPGVCPGCFVANSAPEYSFRFTLRAVGVDNLPVELILSDPRRTCVRLLAGEVQLEQVTAASVREISYSVDQESAHKFNTNEAGDQCSREVVFYKDYNAWCWHEKSPGQAWLQKNGRPSEDPEAEEGVLDIRGAYARKQQPLDFEGIPCKKEATCVYVYFTVPSAFLPRRARMH